MKFGPGVQIEKVNETHEAVFMKILITFSISYPYICAMNVSTIQNQYSIVGTNFIELHKR